MIVEGTVFALFSGLAFGLCDFFAGLASRRASFWHVNIVSLVVSTALAWCVVMVVGEVALDASQLGWSAVAGCGAAVGSTALYRGYACGYMAVVGPLSAVSAAGVPVLLELVTGAQLSIVAWLGVGFALPAIWLMSSTGGRVRVASGSGVWEGLASGLGFALEFIGLSYAGVGSNIEPVALSQSVALFLVLLIVLIWKREGLSFGVARGFAPLAGMLSFVATALYFLAAGLGQLVIAVVLASLYPAIPAVLAAIFLKERPSKSQWLGVAMALLCAALISLA